MQFLVSLIMRLNHMFKLRMDNCPCCKFDIFMNVLYSLFAKTLEYNKRKSRSKILDVLHKARDENFRKP